MKKLIIFVMLSFVSNMIYCQFDATDMLRDAEDKIRSMKREKVSLPNRDRGDRNDRSSRIYTPPPPPTYPYNGINYASEAARDAAIFADIKRKEKEDHDNKVNTNLQNIRSGRGEIQVNSSNDPFTSQRPIVYSSADRIVNPYESARPVVYVTNNTNYMPENNRPAVYISNVSQTESARPIVYQDNSNENIFQKTQLDVFKKYNLEKWANAHKRNIAMFFYPITSEIDLFFINNDFNDLYISAKTKIGNGIKSLTTNELETQIKTALYSTPLGIGKRQSELGQDLYKDNQNIFNRFKNNSLRAVDEIPNLRSNNKELLRENDEMLYESGKDILNTVEKNLK